MKKIFEKISALLGRIGRDKLYHFIICLLTTLFLAPIVGIGLAVFIAWCIALAKEVYDELKGNGFDWWDILADVVGIVCAAVPLHLM